MATTVETSNAVTNITVTTGTQNVFSNIATDSGTVVVDSTVDTLTFTGAGGITTSGTPGTDTITITQGAADISSKSIDDLSDVDTTTATPSNNQVLLFNTSSGKFVPGDVSSGAGYQSTSVLSDLTDVTFSGGLSEGEILVYDASAPTQFVNRGLSGAITLDGDGVTAINSNQVGTTQLDTDNIAISDLANITANISVANTKYIFNGDGDEGIGFFANKLQLSNVELAGSMTISGSHDIGTTSARVNNLFVNNLNASGTITGIDTDDVGEGSSNQYFTNARADARITAASINDLSDVDTTGVANGKILKYNSTTSKFEIGDDADTEDNLANNNTDDLSEGSTNLYFTNARADARVNLQTGTNLDLSNKSTSDLAEGTNLYYTDSRFDTRLATKDTGDLSEGTNLYYTDSRFDTRLATKTTDNLTEGSTNLYFTNARAEAVSINNLSEDTTPQLGGDLDVLASKITSSSSNVVISADTTDKDVIIKVKDAGATLQTAGTFSDYDYVENTTNADSGTATTRYDTILDIDRGIRIGSTANEFSSTGASPNNNNSAYNLSGIIVGNTGNTWPAIDIISNGQATDGSNPLRNQYGDVAAGGLFTQFPNGQLNFKASYGTVGSIAALGSGGRMGQINFYGHDTAGFGGSSATPSIAITGSANETFATDNSRGGKFEIEILPTGGAAGDGDQSSDRRHVFTAVSDSVTIGDHSNDNKYIIVDTANSRLDLQNLQLDLGQEGRVRADDNVDIRIDPRGSGIVRIDTAVRLDNQSGDPSGSGDASHIYAKDESSSSEVFVRDEAGNVTKISPHNQQGEWEYYSRNTKTGKTVRVNMEKMIKDIEQLTGKTYIENE